MKIIGKATLRVHDADGNLVEERHDELNDICWLAWRRFFIAQAGSYLTIATRRDSTNQNAGGARWRFSMVLKTLYLLCLMLGIHMTVQLT